MSAVDETGEARGLHPVVSALRGTDRPPSGMRLTREHLDQRDRAIAAINRAAEEVEKLEDVERGSAATGTSPRLGAIREIKGEMTHLGRRLDSTYV